MRIVSARHRHVLDSAIAFGWIERLGLAAVTLKLCLVHYLFIFIGRDRLDLPLFAAALRQSGLSILPAITLVMAALGLILGRQAAAVLDNFEFTITGVALYQLWANHGTDTVVGRNHGCRPRWCGVGSSPGDAGGQRPDGRALGLWHKPDHFLHCPCAISNAGDVVCICDLG